MLRNLTLLYTGMQAFLTTQIPAYLCYSPTVFTPQRPLGRLGQVTLETLRSQIVSGTLKAGERLLEAELTHTLNVSRTPIRAALQALHAEHLVVPRPGGGYVVAPVNAEDAREVYVVRGSLEGLLAGEAATRWRDADREEIERILHRAELLVDYEEDLKVLGKEFHRAIRRIAGNTLADGLLQNLEPHSDRLRHYTQHVTDNRLIAIRQHRAVADAIFARDQEAAAAAMREHMLSGWERLRKELSVEGATDDPEGEPVVPAKVSAGN